MNNSNTLKEIENAFGVLTECNQRLSPEQFAFVSNPEKWSLAQMYEHICESSKKFFLANIKRCLEQRGGQIGGEKTMEGEWVMNNNGFPNKKVKMPEAFGMVIYTGKPQKEYLLEIEEILNSARDLVEMINQDGGDYKTKHPVFGFFNAQEWFRNLEMHTRHHLRQMAELETLAAHV
ncbi:DinB family protein [Lacihabitans sp. CCS-44]|uniref:DinB family protein n=1 Tax=Lacihabitans sp. CCS-44 TaxID=2487331 RepID=UPI0020CBD8DD|nr:DinB family protein [Lacihabitans sp. CCS-44]MCP9753719.1 DinB family protein [Lacihabitans sp. CCS-44]